MVMVVFLLRLVARTITLTVNFMTTFTFSQQFNQRWSDSPTTVRQAITQELEDIITLLQPDTKLDEFAFTNDELASHIDALYEADRQQPTTVDIQPTVRNKPSSSTQTIDTQAQLPTQAEQMAIDLEADTLEVEVVDSSVTMPADSNRVDLDQTITNDTATQDIDGINDATTQTLEPSGDEEPSADREPSAGEELSADEAPSSKPDAADILHQLEQHVDDIIHDELDTLAANLKLWLRDEVSKRLGVLD